MISQATILAFPRGSGREMQSGAETVKVVPSKFFVNRVQG